MIISFFFGTGQKNVQFSFPQKLPVFLDLLLMSPCLISSTNSSILQKLYKSVFFTTSWADPPKDYCFLSLCFHHCSFIVLFSYCKQTNTALHSSVEIIQGFPVLLKSKKAKILNQSSMLPIPPLTSYYFPLTYSVIPPWPPC